MAHSGLIQEIEQQRNFAFTRAAKMASEIEDLKQTLAKVVAENQKIRAEREQEKAAQASYPDPVSGD